jgi:ribose-phosphate pyrophosphokinase
MQIYSGSTNPSLAQKIAKKLHVPLAKVELSKFPNQETRVWIQEPKVDKKVVVVQSFAGNPNDTIIEYCLLVDALKRSGAKEIIAVIPWMGYCIQDKIFRNGEPLSAKVISEIVENTKPEKVITIDLHNETIQGFFSNVSHLSAIPLYLKHFKNNHEIDIVIAPDVGALKETTKIAQALDLPIATLNKKRNLDTGKVEIVGIDGQIAGKRALIMDDFISTGGTLIQTADYLHQSGVQHITVAVTHHLYIPGTQKRLLNSHINDLYVTDTIQNPDKKLKSSKTKMHIKSITDIICEEINNIFALSR